MGEGKVMSRLLCLKIQSIKLCKIEWLKLSTCSDPHFLGGLAKCFEELK